MIEIGWTIGGRRLPEGVQRLNDVNASVGAKVGTTPSSPIQGSRDVY
jgi:hypothetical protein